MNNVKVSVSEALKPRDTNLNKIYTFCDTYTNTDMTLWYELHSDWAAIHLSPFSLSLFMYICIQYNTYFLWPMRVRVRERTVQYTVPMFVVRSTAIIIGNKSILFTLCLYLVSYRIV